MRRRESKTQTQIRHAKRRINERFGLLLSDDMIRHLANLVRNGKATFIGRQSNRVTLWDVEYLGQPLRVVYDKKRGTIATILTREMGI